MADTQPPPPLIFEKKKHKRLDVFFRFLAPAGVSIFSKIRGGGELNDEQATRLTRDTALFN